MSISIRTTWWTVVVLASAAAACGGGGGAGTASGSARRTSSSAAPAASSGARMPAGGSAGKAQGSAAPSASAAGSSSATAAGDGPCPAILGKAWKAAQPVLAMVGADPAAVEKSYLAGGSFLERCGKLGETERACLEKSDNPLEGIATCKVNDGKAPAESLWLPSVWVDPKPEALSEDDQKQALAALVGTWVSDWKSYKQKTTWKIAADGEVAVETEREGKTDKKTYKIKLAERGVMAVGTTATSSQTYSFLQLDPKTFYSSNNLAYGFFKVGGEKKYTVAVHRAWLMVDGASCKVVNEYAQVADAKCETKGASFTVTHAPPGRTRPDGKPASEEWSYERVGDYLIDQRLIDIGTFKKQ
ncbi:MAG: hypothetical protein HY908_11580 [Myxococcales bacterium]|nr:hypothetical protein [Myxococcales bacterium]